MEQDFSVDFMYVFIYFSLAASCSATGFQLAIEQRLGYAVIIHMDQVTRPSELCSFDVELDFAMFRIVLVLQRLAPYLAI